MNIIEERDARLIRRKLKKKQYDEVITLSVQDTGTRVRLLDEGTVVDGNGNPWFYITKGALSRYLENLPDEYEGSINIGHTDLASFPERIVGLWNKSDLTLVDTGDGRQGLDVDLRLNEEHPLVKALRMAPYDLAVSVEMHVDLNEELSSKYGIDIVDNLFIHDFAIVGEPANVNSTMKLKGDRMDVKELLATLDKEGEKDLSALNAKMDELLAAEAEEVTEEVTEEVELSAEEEVAEEVTEEEVEASVEEEESEEEVSLAAVEEKIEGLLEQISALEAENEELKANLKAMKDAEDAFISKFKKLGVSLSTERTKPVVTQKASYTDGYGG